MCIPLAKLNLRAELLGPRIRMDTVNRRYYRVNSSILCPAVPSKMDALDAVVIVRAQLCDGRLDHINIPGDGVSMSTCRLRIGRKAPQWQVH